MTEKFVRDYVEALRQYFSAKTTAENKEALAKRLRETQPLITEQEFLRRIEPLFNGSLVIAREDPADSVRTYSQLRAIHEVADDELTTAKKLLEDKTKELHTAMKLLLGEIKPARV